MSYLESCKGSFNLIIFCVHVKESCHWRVEKEVELFCATHYNASKGWINDTLKSRYVRVMLLVVVKGKTIFSLYVMVSI